MYWRFIAVILVASWLAACSKPPSGVEVPFAATFAGVPAACAGDDGVALTDLRFYVHNVRLEDQAGQRHNLQLDINDWQQADLAFLDLEDGSGNCINGTALVNDVVRGTVSGQDFRALEFTLGVPFTRNHADPLQATPPLGDADMHWHWRGGYKFLRAGIRNKSDSFWLHLGSTGCEGTIRNITGCSAPNRVTVRIENYQPGETVNIDLASLVTGGVFEDAAPSDCSSGPAEKDCRAAFAALGLDHPSGASAGEQQLFSVPDKP